MKVTGLDNRTYTWPPKGHNESGREGLTTSKFHKTIFDFLREHYPQDEILQELPLPGTGLPPLRLDFYLPLRHLAVEADGRQHEEFIKFFHKNKLEFLRSQKRDRDKEQWLTLNQLTLVRLPVGKSDEWTGLLKGALTGSTDN
jgi:hypothetical protein